MANGKSKDLAKTTESDKVLRDKAIKIASDPKYDEFQRMLTSRVYKVFLVEVVLLPSQFINSQSNFIGRLLENLREEVFIHLLETILGVLI